MTRLGRPLLVGSALVCALQACATRRVIVEVPKSDIRPPETLRWVLRVEGERTRGFGGATHPRAMWTVAHLVESGVVEWTIPGTLYRGRASLLALYSDDDLALMEIRDGVPAVAVLPLAPEQPAKGSRVWWRGMLGDGQETVIHGWYLGIDADGDINVDGWMYSGASGSPLLDDLGRVVGIVRGVANWASRSFHYDPDLRVGGQPVPELLQFVQYISRFRPVGIAEPLPRRGR